ncbi:hypothetical protein Cgig2_032126 [Carnegiea gigantea]|uniref:Uncharacterized protein n=1 Tax=Carnegiea gigantea TaxID=171969 RepID=A0A9Q1JSV5_9CARY|nr:hypothetical protein Cgig2_032126 [Carnegiea gigantea]
MLTQLDYISDLQQNGEWSEWHGTILQGRNVVENVYRWACGRPTALHDRTRDSDDDDLHDRDYDVAALANNLSQAFRPDLFSNEGSEEDNGNLGRDDEDVYFDDESAEVVISSLRLGDDQGSLFTNSNWFTFRDDKIDTAPVGTSVSDVMDDINLNGTASGGNSSSDDEVVVDEDGEFGETKNPSKASSSSNSDDREGVGISGEERKSSEVDALTKAASIQFDSSDNKYLFGEKPVSDWVRWTDTSGLQVDGSRTNPFLDHQDIAPSINPFNVEATLLNGTFNRLDCMEKSINSDQCQRSVAVPSLFEEDVEFVGVEPEGTEKAMEQALKEGIVGEAGPLKKSSLSPKKVEQKPDEDLAGTEFNDANYWRVEPEVAVLE